MKIKDALLKFKIPRSKKETWAFSCQIDCQGCCRDLMTSEPHIREYVTGILQLLNIQPYGACSVVHFGQAPSNRGFSMFQFLEKGSISGHFVDQKQLAYIDLICCSPFDIQKAVEFTQSFFEAKACEVQKKHR